MKTSPFSAFYFQLILPCSNHLKALLISQYNLVIVNTIRVKRMNGWRQSNKGKKVLQLEKVVEISCFQGVDVGSGKPGLNLLIRLLSAVLGIGRE
jgi:hypothetical protein